MSVFFGLGLVLLTYVQKLPNATSGAEPVIFGQASTLLRRDLAIMLAAGGALALLRRCSEGNQAVHL
jgi:manganese/zinc/iron transport system permease protein